MHASYGEHARHRHARLGTLHGRLYRAHVLRFCVRSRGRTRGAGSGNRRRRDVGCGAPPRDSDNLVGRGLDGSGTRKSAHRGRLRSRTKPNGAKSGGARPPPFSSGASPGAGRGAAPAGSVAGNGRFLSPSRSRLRDNGAIAGFAQYGGGRRNRRRRLKRRAVIRSEAGPPARAGRAQPGRALNRGRAGRSGADPQASGSKTSCKAKARSRRALRRRVSGRPARKPAAAPGPALFPGGRAPTCWQARAPFSVRPRLGAEPDPGPVRIVPRH